MKKSSTVCVVPALRTLNWPPGETVYVVRDDDAIAHESASTLVRVTGEAIEVLRPGPVSEQEISRAV